MSVYCIHAQSSLASHLTQNLAALGFSWPHFRHYNSPEAGWGTLFWKVAVANALMAALLWTLNVDDAVWFEAMAAERALRLAGPRTPPASR